MLFTQREMIAIEEARRIVWELARMAWPIKSRIDSGRPGPDEEPKEPEMIANKTDLDRALALYDEAYEGGYVAGWDAAMRAQPPLRHLECLNGYGYSVPRSPPSPYGYSKPCPACGERCSPWSKLENFNETQ